MAILVIEGPDGSGKTTLARMIQQQLQGHGFNEVEYRRSPVKEHGWAYEYNNYLSDSVHLQQSLSTNYLIIQDRIPEISELVYGTVRGKVRCIGYSYGLYSWMGHNIFMVFCKGGIVDGEHFDATGKRLTNQNHRLISKL